MERGHTRMLSMWSLSFSHAPLHPNDRNAETLIAARAVENQFVRSRMLAQSLPTAQTFSPRYPIIIR